MNEQSRYVTKLKANKKDIEGAIQFVRLVYPDVEIAIEELCSGGWFHPPLMIVSLYGPPKMDLYPIYSFLHWWVE